MLKTLALLLLLSCPGQARALRAVSLLPSYTEIIYELGAAGDLVGVSNFCNYPPEAAKLERAGDYLRPNVEKVYTLKPDVVFTGSWAKGVASQLRSLKVKVVALPEEKRVADLFATIRRLAAELGRREAGEELAARLERRLKALPPPEKRRLKVYVEVDAGRWTTGSESFVSDAVVSAGGANAFGGEKRGYFQATWEEVLLLDPQAVILLSGTREEFLARPMAKDMAAVKAGRVITSMDRDAFTRPGPRLIGEIEKLRALLYEQK